MFDPTSIPTLFERARRYRELSESVHRATESAPTLSPEAPPYETQYGGDNLFAQSTELADIAGFYRACGLAAPEKERVDHIAVELEFMSFLAIREAWARYSGATEQANIVRGMAVKFMGEHLAKWVPAFAARTSDREPALCAELIEWVKRDQETLGIPPASIAPTEWKAPGEVEESFSCGGGACELA